MLDALRALFAGQAPASTPVAASAPEVDPLHLAARALLCSDRRM